MSAALVPSELEPDVDDGENIARHRTVVQLVAAFEQSVSDVREGYRLLAQAEDRLDAAFSVEEDWAKVNLRNRYGRRIEDNPDDIIARLRLEVWSHLVERLEIRRFLSVRRATELDQMLDDKTSEKLPDVTVENVLAFANGFRSQVSDMLGEAIEEVFEWLRPHRSEYKTNTELEIGRRVILGWMVEYGWLGRNAAHEYGYRLNYQRDQHVRALENVFTALDGKGSITKTYAGKLADAIRASGPDGKGETEYFRFKCFRNRNLHLEFLRPDLLKRFNAIAGGRRLRPGTSTGDG